MKEWICQEEPLIREDGASVGVGFRQMVEIVRCKGCKHWHNGCCYSRVSNRINFTVEVPDDWFCADGERRTK